MKYQKWEIATGKGKLITIVIDKEKNRVVTHNIIGDHTGIEWLKLTPDQILEMRRENGWLIWKTDIDDMFAVDDEEE